MPVPQEILKNPKISVVIPAYNARKFIAEAIESVLAQTLPAHEIIVVDDGSTDGTGEFVKERYARRVKVIQQENKGASAARNTGIHEATGNILQFLDADDLLLPNKFEVQLDFWRRNPEFDIVYCDYLYFRNGELPTTIPPARPLPQGNLLEILVNHNVVSTLHSALVPRQVVEAVGGFREGLPVGEDRDFWIRCSLQGFTFGYVPKVLVLYRRHGANITANRLRRAQGEIIFCHRMLTMPLPSKLIKFVHRQLAENYAELALAQLAERQWVASWKSLWKAWHHHCVAAKLAGNRDKALWLIDVLRWVNQFFKTLQGKDLPFDDPVLR